MAQWIDDAVPDLTGKVAIVTGANSGLGYETARALAAKGATVVMAVRTIAKGGKAAGQICDEHPSAALDLVHLDLADLASVRRAADDICRRYPALHLLINNAGVMALPKKQVTTDGFEMQFGTNHLGHFALTGLLFPMIARTPGARVVTVSSFVHRLNLIKLDNLNAERWYQKWNAYGTSKIANLLFTYELQRRFEADCIDALAVAAHPGWTNTNLQQHSGIFNRLNPVFGQSPLMGALPTLYAATVPDVRGGEYYGPGGLFELRGYPKRVKSSRKSHDRDLAARLWALSEEMTGVQFGHN